MLIYIFYLLTTDSVRAFKEKMKLGRFSEQSSEDAKKREAEEEEAVKTITVGSRCEVTVGNESKRRGTVMYVGQCAFSW